MDEVGFFDGGVEVLGRMPRLRDLNIALYLADKSHEA